MADSILEQIAQDLYTTLTGVAEADDPSVQRPRREGLADSPGHRSLALFQAGSDKEDAPPGSIQWLQSWYVALYLTPPDDDDTPIDTTTNNLRSDVEKALMTDPQRSNLAIDTEIHEPLDFADDQVGYAGIAVHVRVRYRTLIDDPFSAG